MSKKEDIGKLFSDSLKDFEKSPTSTTMESIEALLDQNEANTKKTNRYRLLALLLLLSLSSGILFYYFSSTTETSEPQLEITNTSQEQNATEIVDTQQNHSENSTNTTTQQVLDSLNTTVYTSKTNNSTSTPQTDQNTLAKSSEQEVKNTSKTKHSFASTRSNNNTTADRTSNAQQKLANTKTKNDKVDQKVSQASDTSEMKMNTNAIAQNKTTLQNDPSALDKETEIASNTQIVQDQKNDTTALAHQTAQLKDEIAENPDQFGDAKDRKKSKDTLIYMERLKEGKEQPTRFSIHTGPYLNFKGNGSAFSDEAIDFKEKGGLTMSYGAHLSTYFSKKIGLEVGYNYMGLKTKLKAIPGNTARAILQDMQVNSTFQTQIRTQDTLDISQKINYHEFSAGLTYLVYQKDKLDIEATAGGSFWFRNNSKLNIDLPNQSFDGESETLLSTNGSFNLGANLLYRYTDKLHFVAVPRFKYMLRNISTNENSYQPFYFGIQFGVSFKLN